MDASEWPTWLTRHESAAYLLQVHGIRAGYTSLANFAVSGTGPKFSRQGKPGGRVIYHRDDLDTWAKTRKSRRVSSTAELREHAA
jgi:hypothetical protein